MGWSTSVIAPPDGNMGDYLRSLEKLLQRDDAILYPTHGSPITLPPPFLRALITHRRMREGQIAVSLARGDDTVPAMVARLYAGLSPMLVKAAELTVLAHLQHMMEDGRVAQDGARYRVLSKAP
jgi:glyoxylase-like metal-dependent hydrolase (beta-lactamase superfamily II)